MFGLERKRIAKELKELARKAPVEDWLQQDRLQRHLSKKCPKSAEEIRAVTLCAKALLEIMSKKKDADIPPYILPGILQSAGVSTELATWCNKLWFEVLSQEQSKLNAFEQHLHPTSTPPQKTLPTAPNTGTHMDTKTKSTRIEIGNQIKAHAEAQETQANAQRKPEAERRLLLIECWRLAFPTESQAIQQAADSDLKEQAWETRPLATFGSTPDSEVRSHTAKFIVENSVQKDRDVDAEIWRRIRSAPDQEALQQKLKVHLQGGLAQRKVEERHQHFKNLEQRKMQAEADERNRQAKEKQQKRQEQQRQAKAEERKKMEQAEKEKQAYVQDFRKRFPLQCAGLSDDEVIDEFIEQIFDAN